MITLRFLQMQQLQLSVVSEKQKQKTYKVISYNDLGEYKVYTIIVDKNKA
ncbi:hypothetical protein NW069_02650 [Mycoplasmopsis cynos]|nr:hypothetical protein [Mycoplasmopsis cynos]UWV80245.1 hypothetical protein NW069_02650 [Mycoplasmopsis cynos]